jgi:uncharacterized protein YhdP
VQRQTWILGLASAVGLALAVALGYQLALAKVPQHRAALERLVQSQTGLDIRFSELGLRWGWYGPEAVFRSVELGEPGRSNVLLRAPELTVGFDAWRSMRSGQLEAGRITLIAPDIDFERFGPRARTGEPRGAVASAHGAQPGQLTDAAASAPTDRVKLLQRWRDGRIDVEGGSLRLPDPNGSSTPFVLQIRRAAVRRAADEWNLFALVFLPERLGRTARLALQINGSLDKPETLSGTARLEARRLTFAGWRDFRSVAPTIVRYAPVAGSGDATLNLEFQHGRLIKASGDVHAGGVMLDSGEPDEAPLNLDRVRGEWRLARRADTWRFRVDTLQLGDAKAPATLTAEAGEAGDWIHGTLEQAPLQSVAAMARWLAPHLTLGDAEIGGLAREVAFDWDRRREAGNHLNVVARLEDVAVRPPAHEFSLTGINARISGNEESLTAEVQGREANLELEGAPQYPLEGVHVTSTVKIARRDGGWEVSTNNLELRHELTRLEVAGSLEGAPTALAAHFVLTNAEVPFLKRALGSQASAAESLLAGHLEKAEFDLRDGESAGSAVVRNAILTRGDQWPQAENVDAQVDWRGSKVRARLERGRAGPFELVSGEASWEAGSDQPAQLTAVVHTRMQEALAWIAAHPGTSEYVSRLRNLDLDGDTTLNVDMGSRTRVTASFTDARFTLVSGAAPIENLSGSVAMEDGRLQRTVLTGSWLGGPVTLRVNERRNRGKPVLAMQARGVLDAAQLARLTGLDVDAHLSGTADWTGELTYMPQTDSQPTQWRVRADSNLLSVGSDLPDPLAKPAGTPVPLRVELSGTDNGAQLRVMLGDRLRSLLAFQRGDENTWRLERGSVNFGSSVAQLPTEPLLLIQGRVSRLDLPAYLAVWQQTRQNPQAPVVRAQLVAGELVVAGRTYPEVTLVGSRNDSEAQLTIDSSEIAGVARWPLAQGAARPVEVRLSRLSLPERSVAGEANEFLPPLGRNAHITVDDLEWNGHDLGHLSTTYASREDGVVFDDVRLTGSSHDGSGVVRCAAALATCKASFTLDSRDAQQTLEDFGFRPDVSAAKASFDGDIEWTLTEDRPWIASISGRLSLRLAEGTTRDATADEGSPLGLLGVPALTRDTTPLKFARLEADYSVKEGQASTSDLHFDGDAEILMRGHTGLVSRSYDQQVWILKGEERLPAPVRKLGPSPRFAAAWMTLREMLAGIDEDRVRPTLRLSGTWDEPTLVEK